MKFGFKSFNNLKIINVLFALAHDWAKSYTEAPYIYKYESERNAFAVKLYIHICAVASLGYTMNVEFLA